MDEAREIARDALENNNGFNSNRWYFQVITHTLAFGLGYFMRSYQLDARMTKMEEALALIKDK